MLTTCVALLVVDPDGIYVDATFGGGGHSKAILAQLGASARLLAFDQDIDALQHAPDDDRLVLIHSNFRFLSNHLQYHGISQVDGILADLGVSSFQLDEGTKGFSFQHASKLDMRMNQTDGESAAEFLNRATVEELIAVLSEYGEVRNAKSLARGIISFRHNQPLKTVQDFLTCVSPFVFGNRARYLAQVFQAIRIKVNNEMGALQALLKTTVKLLKPGGRLLVLTYHSVEDRMVKHFMRNGTFAPREVAPMDAFGQRQRWPFTVMTRKPMVPSDVEITENPRARSAKLRIAEKLPS